MDAYTLGTLLDDIVMAVVCARLAVVAARRLGQFRQGGRLAVARIPATLRHPTRDAAVPGRTGNEVQA